MAFVIPSIYTAVDRVSTVVKRITTVNAAYNRTLGGTNVLSARQSSIISTQNTWFRRLTPALGEATSQLLAYAKATAVVGGAMAIMAYSGRQIVEYEKNLASFRVIVSDLSNKDFKAFKSEIGNVANATKKSTVVVAQAFENIAGLNADFAKTSDGLGAVATSAITMAKAANMELGPAAENLVGIMNQFNMQATEASRVANVLAAGQAVGASSIGQSAEAYKNFGAVAAKSNITLEQSQALIQTLASKMIMGAEAGTALRGVTLKMQKAGIGYKSGTFQINDALAEMQKRLQSLTSSKDKDAYMTKVFGAENITAGSILLNNISTYQDFTKGVTGTNAAMEAAAINSNTLGNRWEELKAKWTNMITTSDESSASLEKVKSSLVWFTENMPTIVEWTGKIVGAFVLWKGLIYLTAGAMWGYNVALGVYTALSGGSALATAGNTTAYIAYRAALTIGTGVTWLATAAQSAFNAVMSANPIALVVLAIAALVAIIVLVIKKWDTWGKYVNLMLGPLGLVIELIQSVRRNWDMVKDGFTSGGILGGLKAIGVMLLDVVLSPLQRILELAAMLPGKMGEWAKSGANSLAGFRSAMGVGNVNETYNRNPSSSAIIPVEKQMVSMMYKPDMPPPQNSKSTVELVLKGNTDAVDVSKNKSNIPITLNPSMVAW